MKRYIINIIRILVGILFTLSGFVKLVDPKGTSYKLQEYFSEDALSLVFLQPYTLYISIVFVIAETMLGIFLLLGAAKKFTLRSLLGLIVFFSFLTFYSAYYNKVQDCGCFGDALKLSPWESFYKDLVLLLAIIILLIGARYIKPLFSLRLNFILLLILTITSASIAYFGVHYLPIIDFRPYAVGENLKQNRKDQKKPTVKIDYTLKNKETGEKKIIDSKEYIKDNWWQKQAWEMQTNLTQEKTIDEGIPAKIHDFVIKDESFTQQILNEDKVFLIINYELYTNEKDQKLRPFIKNLENQKYDYYLLSSVDMKEFDKVYYLDGIALKTIIRSSPGIILMEKGIVKNKWSWRGLPTLKELSTTK